MNEFTDEIPIVTGYISADKIDADYIHHSLFDAVTGKPIDFADPHDGIGVSVMDLKPDDEVRWWDGSTKTVNHIREWVADNYGGEKDVRLVTVYLLKAGLAVTVRPDKRCEVVEVKNDAVF